MVIWSYSHIVSPHFSMHRRVLQAGPSSSSSSFIVAIVIKITINNNILTSSSRDEFVNTWPQFARGGGRQVLAILGGFSQHSVHVIGKNIARVRNCPDVTRLNSFFCPPLQAKSDNPGGEFKIHLLLDHLCLC